MQLLERRIRTLIDVWVTNSIPGPQKESLVLALVLEAQKYKRELDYEGFRVMILDVLQAKLGDGDGAYDEVSREIIEWVRDNVEKN